ncbi:tyrosine-type recombinase/integrase [Geomesophilobacter sediminis]|uniref:Tyrosine-type recombinase/integrase n=1 Tax=Geomesophilobacter sediminis TaxID=2798584 RepID=A0A8J7LW24_9BACT|nr:tyrosine-type recombinase/integrase [Geomesophilobacter sediminis]MBJ6725410.1 tyrosine-type recombinase/integrase [Geomesophilobacter sediminis]
MGKDFKLTKTTVERLPYAEKGKQNDFFDSELPSFGVRVSHSAKTYFVRKRINGKNARVNIGRHGVLTADTARKEAIMVIADLGKGVDINREKAKARVRGMTLAEVLDKYFVARTGLKPRTIKTYRDLFRLYLADWLRKPLEEITKDMVARRHLEIAKNHGDAAANNTMRTLRAIYNFGNEILDDTLPVNPVKRLSNTKQWFTIERRQTVIEEVDLPAWFAAVNGLENVTIRDFFLLLLLTGARRTETASLPWGDVDLEKRRFVLMRTKNGKPLYLPMSDFIFDLFTRRSECRENAFVFPGSGKDGHLKDPRKQMLKVTAQTGVEFCIHDMRRTFTSAIDGVVGYYELKKLLNHSTRTDDVTAGYVIKNLEKLRPLMQKVTDHILSLCRRPEQETGNIIDIEARRKDRA